MKLVRTKGGKKEDDSNKEGGSKQRADSASKTRKTTAQDQLTPAPTKEQKAALSEPSNQVCPDGWLKWKEDFRTALGDRQPDLFWSLLERDILTAHDDPDWNSKAAHLRPIFVARARQALAGLYALLAKTWPVDGVMMDAERFYGKSLPRSAKGPTYQVAHLAEAIRDLSLHAAVLLQRASKEESQTPPKNATACASQQAFDFIRKWHTAPHERNQRKNQRRAKKGGKPSRTYSNEFMERCEKLITDLAWEHLDFWSCLPEFSEERCTPNSFKRQMPIGCFGDPQYRDDWFAWMEDMLLDSAFKGILDRSILSKRMSEIRRDLLPRLFNNFS
jgi:hypothetical protein